MRRMKSRNPMKQRVSRGLSPNKLEIRVVFAAEGFNTLLLVRPNGIWYINVWKYLFVQ